jgi:hypothetical protein
MSLGKEIKKGFGRRGGWKLFDLVENQIEKHTLDTKSNFRKHMNTFKMPGTFRGGLAKMNQTFDLFIEEYESTKAIFQESFYKQDDIKAIERKIRNLEILIENDRQQIQYNNLIGYWENDIKNQSK